MTAEDVLEMELTPILQRLLLRLLRAPGGCSTTDLLDTMYVNREKPRPSQVGSRQYLGNLMARLRTVLLDFDMSLESSTGMHRSRKAHWFIPELYRPTQPVSQRLVQRAVALLHPFPRRIVHALNRAGAAGLDMNQMLDLCYEGTATRPDAVAHVMICRARPMLHRQGLTIVVIPPRGPGARYYLAEVPR